MLKPARKSDSIKDQCVGQLDQEILARSKNGNNRIRIGKVVTLVIGLIDLISALAWPSAVLVIAFLFRHEVRGVLTRLGQFKYGGVEMTFRDDLRDAETLARAVPATPSSSDNAQPLRVQLEVGANDAAELVGTLVGHETSTATTVLVASPVRAEPRPGRSVEAFLRLCGESPREGILEAWADLRNVLIQAAATLGDRRAPAPVRVEGAVRFLVDRGWINTVEGQLVERLRGLASQVEHRAGAPVSLEDARRFVELAVPILIRVAALGSVG